MKKTPPFLVLALCVALSSCFGTDDDSNKACTANCNGFNGRIYTENNVGVPNVEVTLRYELHQVATNYQRIIAKVKTDENGYYDINAYIKDNEFNGGYFLLEVDRERIESAVGAAFYKPSELMDEVGPGLSSCVLQVHDRTEVITTDYKIPYKTSLTVNLNDFSPVTPNDWFAVANRIPYGFQQEFVQEFLPKVANSTGWSYATGATTTYTIPAFYGENNLTLSRYRNGSIDYQTETITVTNPNTVAPLSYSF